MDAKLFAKMISDKSITDLRKLKYKYPAADIQEFVEVLQNGFYESLPLKDFRGNDIVYLKNTTAIHMNAVKVLLSPRNTEEPFGLKAMEEEISSTLNIENIDFSRDSVRKILKGYAPADESEQRIFGMKKGLEFISNPQNRITDESIYHLYQLAIGAYLDDEDQLLSGNHYRHDSVYIVGQEVEHTGIAWQLLPERMNGLCQFIASDDGMNDLLKAAVIHFYIAYLHPYFDGNGRMARLVHLWYLVQQGYSSALFIPLSEYIEKSRKKYYQAYTLAEKNMEISGTLDVTPFLLYFIQNVYHQLDAALPESDSLERFQKALQEGSITEKEKDLWQFVLSAYGNREFSTKQVEKDFGNAAYATIRGFVLKFEKLGLLAAVKYGSRIKYRIK